jgi:probable addiction module antidote protein
MAEKFKEWDTADILTSEEMITEYLNVSFEGNDLPYAANALGTVARAKGGMTKLASETGIAREALHRALSYDGNPEFATVLKVMKALGLRLAARPAASGSKIKAVPLRKLLRIKNDHAKLRWDENDPRRVRVQGLVREALKQSAKRKKAAKSAGTKRKAA